MAYGDIGAPVDTLEYELTDVTGPKIVHVSGDIFAIAYTDADGDGKVVSIDITKAGLIGAAVIDSLEFDAVDGHAPSIVHVSGDVFAIAYRGVDVDGWVCTVSIAADGQIGAAVIDTLEFCPANMEWPDIIHVSGDVYAIAYEDAASDGMVCTVSIAANGQIGAAIIDSLEFGPDNGQYPKIVKVSSGVFAIACTGADFDGFVYTVEIAANGQIAAGVIDSLEFDTVDGFTPTIAHVSGDIFAIAYRDGTPDGWVCTVSITAAGEIGAAILDTLNFDATRCLGPKIILLHGGICAIAYEGVLSDGFVVTIQIETDGQIGAAVLDSLEYDTTNGVEPDILRIAGDQYVIAYKGSGDDGFIKTPTIETPGAPKHLTMMGIGG